MELWEHGSPVILQESACRYCCWISYLKTRERAADKKPRNKIVNDALQPPLKVNPSPVFTKDVLKRITTGNFEDNMKDIASCDWIIEVVVERLDIKQKVFEQVRNSSKARNADHFEYLRHSYSFDGGRKK